jgi:hypothetical protein
MYLLCVRPRLLNCHREERSDVAISPPCPKPPPPAHAGHIARDLGLASPKKSHMHDMAINGQGRADDLFPHIPEIAAHPDGFVAFFAAARPHSISPRSPMSFFFLCRGR